MPGSTSQEGSDPPGNDNKDRESTLLNPRGHRCLILWPPAAHPCTDSDFDIFEEQRVPSSGSLASPGHHRRYPNSSTPTVMNDVGPDSTQEPYPAWCTERGIPLSMEEIEDIFLDLTQKFGFQRDSMRNMVRFPAL